MNKTSSDRRAGKAVIPQRGRPSVGGRIIAGLNELRAALESGEPLERRFTVRTISADLEPSEYDSRRLISTRRRLGASQAAFARLVGASAVLVRSWEHGDRQPSRMARRLLDEINRDPARWLEMLNTGARRGSAA